MDAPRLRFEDAHPHRHHRRWRIRMRPPDDDEPQDWWFASQAIPLIAATTGPLANLLSIAALISSWRENLPDNGEGPDDAGEPFPDPRWCIALNATSLVCGFLGNIFLLFNFTRTIRYIIALPMTIILWYFATAILIAIVSAMHIWCPPIQPQQTYAQAFWYAVIAAVMYLVSSSILLVNMLGYSLGHYPQHFTLSDDQRTLILQTMLFFIWLGGGGGVFSRVSGWIYCDGLYFADVTILTVGFGDFHAVNNLGRGLLFFYSVGGIIILGLMVNSIHRFSLDMGRNNVIRKQLDRRRIRTVGRSVTTSSEYRERVETFRGRRPVISGPISINNDAHRSVQHNSNSSRREHASPFIRSFARNATAIMRPRPKLILLREEKDRFDKMREIQADTASFKRWSALCISCTSFGILWCVGAVVFWRAEQRLQQLTYFEALYFCYVSLLTIGYGDLSPQSNAGKPFFVIWSLIAVPTITVLISDMGETIIASFRKGTFTFAEWTVLPRPDLWQHFLKKNRNSRLAAWVSNRAAKQRVEKGFPIGPEPSDSSPPTLEQLAGEGDASDRILARRLVKAIKQTVNDLKQHPRKKYSYEEWVEYTRLIRFTSSSVRDQVEAEEGLIEWDWIGENSPLVADETEAEFILHRLIESLDRYLAGQDPTVGPEFTAKSSIPEADDTDGTAVMDDEDGGIST